MLFTSTSFAREELGHLRAVDRPAQLRPVSEPELVPQRRELAAVLPLQLGQRRAVHGQPNVEPAVERAAKRAQRSTSSPFAGE